MPLSTTNPTGTLAWQELRRHFADMQYASVKELFATDSQRAERFNIRSEDFLFDYSKNFITDRTRALLLDLAREMELETAIKAYFSGEAINRTENRAVMHTALRAPSGPVTINGVDVYPEIQSVKEKMRAFCHEVINGGRKGFTGKLFTDVVNIGIGGSDLGPAMAVEALAFYRNHLRVHFVSNVDGDHVHQTLKDLDPETTLFVIVSKTFTTQETLSNSETARDWFLKSAHNGDIASHFVAVSTNIERVTQFGIDSRNIFPMWDWVGGRFSLWSAVGLSIALATGYDNFEKLLQGAHRMDNHFRNTAFEENIPVMAALLTIWYNNFYGAQSEAVIPYSQYLHKLAPYLQQGIMESNGKSIGRDGNPVNYETGTVIWGEPGTNSQHAFFQLIHQGTKLIPSDFIGFVHPLHGDRGHHRKLMSNFFAQTEALLNGKDEDAVKAEFQNQGITGADAAYLLPFKVFRGDKPTTTILIDRLTPESLGSLIAMYEHKIFVQGVIWNIYSYDQWGVELGKQLANNILSEIEKGEIGRHDGSTDFLLKEFLGRQNT